MDHIDVRDLSEEEARFIAALVEFLRCQRQEAAQQEMRQAEAPPPPRPFAVWPLGVKDALNRDWDNNEDAIYDNWKEHYQAPER